MSKNDKSNRVVILPCPDCGSEGVRCGDFGVFGVRCSNYFECNNAGVVRRKQGDAIKAWNRLASANKH